MNLAQSRVSMSTGSSSAACKGGEVVPDQFPAGLRVLVVDDDPTCLRILEKMLQTCLYEVTTCNRAETALSKLRNNKNGFDIVISDVHMPDMNGFKLLEHIGLEMDLPVIMMSADDGKSVVMKGVVHGACDYLIKPVRIEALKNIWQHVVRRKKNEWRDLEQSGSVEDGDRMLKASEEADYSSSANEGNWRNSKRRKDEEEEPEERDDSSTLKKPRVVWSVELHQQFVAAVNQLGIEKAVPKKILELMNVPGLTRENVASHLQKYRLYLRRLSGVSQHQGSLNNSFFSPQDAIFGPMSSLNGLDLQTLAVAGKLSPQSLATLQAAGLGRPSPKSPISVPIIDQRNIFSFENPKLRFSEGQQQQLNSTKPINLLHGIPTTMEPKQLANLTHTAQTRGHVINETTSSLAARLPSSMGQPIMSNGIGGAVMVSNGMADNSRVAGYNIVSQTLNFPMNQNADFQGHSLPLQSTPKAGFVEEDNSEMKGSGGRFVPSYDIFNDLHQQKSHDWVLQNTGLAFDASQLGNSNQGNLNVSSSVVLHQGFSSSQRNGQNSNASTAGRATVSFGEATENVNAQNICQQINSILFDNSVRVKAEAIPDASSQTILFPEHFGQEDLMSVLLKQQQEGIGPAENEFDFDGYSIDNIPV